MLTLVCSCALFGQQGEALLAIVGDEVITTATVQQQTALEEKQLALTCQGAELQQRIQELRKQALDNLIDKELLFLEFQTLKAKLPPNILQERLNRIVLARTNGDLVRFEELLQNEGMTMTEFKKRLHKEIAVELLVRDRLTRGNLVSDRDVIKYYLAHKESLAQPPRYHIAVIQLRKDGKFAGKHEATLQEILHKLAEGVPFAELAKQYSEGANAENGGDQGWMPALVPKLQEEVDKMQSGQTSAHLIDIGSSYYIVQLIAHEKGGVPELDAPLKEKIREILRKQEEKRRYDEYLRTLYMKYPVSRMDQK
ncbi:MAG: SurA N-terminal domain-containing protein [Victivallales bacterium]|nr:SurA N-terminal domain-containing protein [Victivallales bacterium]